MKIIRGRHNWPVSASPCVATIGNFDGVHLGHQALFRQLKSLSARHALPATVISFEPLPHEYFQPDTRSLRLQQLRDRIRSIAGCEIDQLLLLAFNSRLSRISAEAFVEKILLEQLKVRHLLIGDDFRFGAARVGDLDLLQRYRDSDRFEVTAAETFSLDADRVSSTRIRAHLRNQQLDEVQQLLGRPYSINGLVVRGQQVGRTLGFPTANILLKAHRPLLRGVFAVTAEDGRTLSAEGVANLGERPTVDGRRLLLEVHLPGRDENLYGRHLTITFRHHIRNEQKFDSLEALKSAIANDIDAAAAFFSGHH